MDEIILAHCNRLPLKILMTLEKYELKPHYFSYNEDEENRGNKNIKFFENLLYIHTTRLKEIKIKENGLCPRFYYNNFELINYDYKGRKDGFSVVKDINYICMGHYEKGQKEGYWLTTTKKKKLQVKNLYFKRGLTNKLFI